jgi:hypothetical protein
MKTAVLIFLAAGLIGSAADKKKVTPEAGNENVDLTAKALLTPEDLKTALGAELPPGVVALEVKVVPKGDYKLSISRDDFILLSHRDGQRSGPYSPSQIAGSATMVVRSQTRAGSGGGMGRQGNGPIWGGIPGTGGRPRQVDDGSGGVIGSTTTSETDVKAEVKDNKGAPENPLLKVLQGKMLPEKETNDPVTGLLYFPLEGKVKLKDLELIYKGPAGRLYIEFM